MRWITTFLEVLEGLAEEISDLWIFVCVVTVVMFQEMENCVSVGPILRQQMGYHR